MPIVVSTFTQWTETVVNLLWNTVRSSVRWDCLLLIGTLEIIPTYIRGLKVLKSKYLARSCKSLTYLRKSILLFKPQGCRWHKQCRWRWAWSTWAWSTASQEQTLSGTGALVYTAHRGWLGVVTAIGAASTGGFLVYIMRVRCVGPVLMWFVSERSVVLLVKLDSLLVCWCGVLVNGQWSFWSSWSRCSVSCGEGTRHRTRRCDNPAPSDDGRPCVGTSTETKACIVRDCPSKSTSLSPPVDTRTMMIVCFSTGRESFLSFS